MKRTASSCQFALPRVRCGSVPTLSRIQSQHVGHNRLLAALDPAILALLEKAMRRVSLERGTTLHEQGEPIKDIYFPHTGVISCVINTRDGKIAEAATVGSEGAVGLHSAFDERRAASCAVVQIGGEFLTISARDFYRIAGDEASVRNLIVRYTEILCAEAQKVAACNIVHGTEQRLCRWLLQCTDRANINTLPLTQEFLGQMLGVNRTTVNFIVQPLQSKGLIRYSRGKIQIVDRAGLKDRACECYEAMRADKLAATFGVAI